MRTPLVPPLQSRVRLALSLALLLALPGGLEGAPDDGETATDNKPELELRVREVKTDTSVPEPAVPEVSSRPLTVDELHELGARVPRPRVEAPAPPFRLPPGPKPPPRVGDEVLSPFPPRSSEGTAPDAPAPREPLRVIRHAPDGEVPQVPRISVTFSQAMIALASTQAEAEAPIPVQIDPQVQGLWRWAGTRALIFEPTRALPGATEFTVTVDTTARSVHGTRLAEPYRFRFSTPAPKVVRVSRLEGQRPPGEPTLIEFDQRIDPRAVLPRLSLQGAGRNWPLRLATVEEVATIKQRTEDAAENHWLAVLPVDSQPEDATLELGVGPGVPSAEGPRRNRTMERFRYRTVGPLRLESWQCRRGQDCRPGLPWHFKFNAALDGTAIDDDVVEVTPELPDQKVRWLGNSFTVHGNARGRTTYRVRLRDTIVSRYGRRLEDPGDVTIKVGPPTKQLYSGQEHLGFGVLEPTKRPSFSLHSVNLARVNIALYTVTPEEWEAYATHQRDRRAHHYAPPGYGRPVFGQTLEVKDLNTPTEHKIDLTPALRDGRGHVVVWASEAGGLEPKTFVFWLQITDIALDVFTDSEEILVFATSLRDGRPLEGIRVTGHQGVTGGTTGSDGTARLELRKLPIQLPSGVLIARRGNDVCLVPEAARRWRRERDSQWVRKAPRPQYRSYIVDDSGIYRPGETVKVKGWARRQERTRGGTLRGLPPTARSVHYKLRGPQGEEISEGEAPLSPLGGFDLSLELPEDVGLGRAVLTLDVPTEDGKPWRNVHSLKVQEFRRPDFEVTIRSDGNVHQLGEEARLTAEASYYSGSHLAGAGIEWEVWSEPGEYSPPGHDDFLFGERPPWWSSSEEDRRHAEAELKGTTDRDGRHRIAVSLSAVDPPAPMSISAEVRVEALDQQTIAASTTLLVHPSAHYVGLRAPRAFVTLGKDFALDTIVTDVDGSLQKKREIRLLLERLEWTLRPLKNTARREWVQTVTEVERRTIESADNPVTTRFVPREGGSYRITASIEDDEGRPNQSKLDLWVAGGNPRRSQRIEEGVVRLVPEKDSYAPGDTARVLVQAPFFPADGLLTVRRLGLVEHQHFRVTGPTHALEVPLSEGHVPNLIVHVELVGRQPLSRAAGAARAEGPAFASGQLDIAVSPARRTLSVHATPRESELPPAATTTIDLLVEQADGKPAAGAEVAVVVVDEAVLALVGHSFPDPVDTFYGALEGAVHDRVFRRHVLRRPASEQETVGQIRELRSLGVRMESAGAAVSFSLGDGAGGGGAGADGAVALRSVFDSRILFAPRVITGADGRTSVDVTLADSLTSYRVMALAAHGERYFGQGEAAITARLPVMVRATPPRFLHRGDVFELPVVVDNQSTEDRDVDVLVRAFGSTPSIPEAGRRLTVSAGTQAAVSFPLDLRNVASHLQLQVAAVTGGASDGAEYGVPVWLPVTAEATATYGTVADNRAVIRQPVSTPQGVIPSHGGLEITTSTTALHELTDAFLYLVDYPFDCAEQIASRVIAVAALRDALDSFADTGLPDREALDEAVARDLDALREKQNHDGGFGFWRRNRGSWPYLSAHVAHALLLAQRKGYTPHERTVERALRYLTNIETHIPATYGAQPRLTIRAYALRVLAEANRAAPARVADLVHAHEPAALPTEAAAWLLGALRGDQGEAHARRTLERLLSARASESASTAQFSTGYDSDSHLVLHSSRRTDAVVLDAILAGGASRGLKELAPKLVRGLLGHRRKGRWSNTQENTFVLLALGRYFETYEKETPDFTTRVWLSDAFVTRQIFEGRSADHRHTRIPTEYLQTSDRRDLILEKSGTGRLYYRLGLNYAPVDPRVEALSRGFVLERSYEAVDDEDDVRREDDGSWHIRSGARVRVRTSIVAPERRYHVALVDPLPAGLEPLNPELRTTGRLPGDDGNEPRPLWCWYVRWYEHANLRDRGAEVFTSLLLPGVAEYSYFARATTAGTFIAPAARVEEMYQPETFGRTASDVVIVEAR